MSNYKSTLRACYLGYITQAAIVNLAPLLFVIFMDQFHVSFEALGRLILINFGAQLITDLASVKLVAKLGARRSAILAHLACGVGLALMGLLPSLLPSAYLGLVLATLVFAFGGGLIEVLVSPIVDAIPGDAKEAAMSLLHSFYCWGQVLVVLLSTLYIRFAGAQHWAWLPLIWAVLPLLNALNFARVPLPPSLDEGGQASLRELFGLRLFLVGAMLMMCAGAAEQAIAQWASLFAELGLGVDKLTGDLLGPLSFAACMGVGRMLYGFFGAKLNMRRMLTLCSGLCIVGYLVLALVKLPLVSLLGCALCGLSVSLMWPGVLSLTFQSIPQGGPALFGTLALFGDLGCSVGPWLAGLVSGLVQQRHDSLQALPVFSGLAGDQIGLKCGLLAAVIFPLLMLLFVRRLKNRPGPASRA